MMRAIVGWSLRYRLLVLGLAGALLLVGYTQLSKVPVDAVPEFAPPYVEIQTEALGLSAEEVEQLITVPLEADLLQGVAFLDEIHSESIAGLSSIVLIFEPGTDTFRARQVVAERLTQAHALPNVSKAPAMLQPLSSASRVLMVSLSSDDASLVDMSVLTRWTIRPRLMGVPGVANVAVWGQRERQLQVLVDPERLRDQRVQLQHVIETTGNALWVSPLSFLDASTPGTGGFIDTPNQRLGVQHIFPIRSPEDLAQMPIPPEDTGGRIVRLGDVATVVEDHQPLIGNAIVDDGPGLLLVVEKFPNADTLAVTRGVEEALSALQPALGGIRVDSTIFRPATFLEEATGNVSLALASGFGLLVTVLFVFFRGWRSALIALVAILLSMASAALVIYLSGASINAIVMAGLVLGIAAIVDDAIVGIDGVARRLRHPKEGDAAMSTAALIREATVESRGAMAYATLVVVLAMVPLFAVGGVPAAFLPSLLVAYLLAIVASTAVAMSVTPALALLVLGGLPRVERETVLARRLRDTYTSVLAAVLRWARPVLAVAAVLTIGIAALAGAIAVPTSGDSFVPPFRERDLLIRWDGAPGTSHPEMTRIVARASAELRTIPGIRNVGGQVGRAVTSDQVVGVNAGELWISIDRGADYDRTVAAVEAVIDGYPGLRRAVVTYTSSRIDQVLGQPEPDVVVRVYGQDAAVLGSKAEEVRQGLSEIGGLADVAVVGQDYEPTLQIEVDLAAAQRYGLRPGDVRRATATLLSGIEVGFLFEAQKVFEVVVWGVPELRQSLTSIRNLPIEAPGGQFVTLGEVADVRIGSAPAVVSREGVFRYVDVGASVAGRDLDAVLGDVKARLAEIQFPLEHRAEIMGAAAGRQADMRLLLVVTVAAAIGMMLLLQASFGRWRPASFLLVSLPIATVGAVLVGVASGGFFSIGIVAGLLGVVAIALRQGLLMMSRLQRLEREREGAPRPDLILDGARERLAPILSTAIGTALAMTPFFALSGRPGLEIVGPMALVIVAGLITSTLFALFVVPAGYLLAGPSPEPDAATLLAEQPGFSPA